MEIMSRRFGLWGQHEETLEEIGQLLSITRERVRQIESKALKILQHPKQAKYLVPHAYP